jgi:hypothetical protein
LHLSDQEELSKIRPNRAHSGTTQFPDDGLLDVLLANLLITKETFNEYYSSKNEAIYAPGSGNWQSSVNQTSAEKQALLL